MFKATTAPEFDSGVAHRAYELAEAPYARTSAANPMVVEVVDAF